MITSALHRPCLPLLLFVVVLAAACSGQNEESPVEPAPRRRPTVRDGFAIRCSSRQPCASRWISRSPATSTNW